MPGKCKEVEGRGNMSSQNIGRYFYLFNPVQHPEESKANNIP